MVSRFDVPEADAEVFQQHAQAALQAFAARPGFVRGRVGRAPDETTAWVLSTEWEGVASYRRSLSGFDVKMTAPPLYAWGRDETSAFEIVLAEDTPQPGRVLPTHQGKEQP